VLRIVSPPERPGRPGPDVLARLVQRQRPGMRGPMRRAVREGEGRPSFSQPGPSRPASARRASTARSATGASTRATPTYGPAQAVQRWYRRLRQSVRLL